MYLLDTNMLIYIINDKSAKLSQKLKTFKPLELSTCSIVVSELYFGVQKSRFKEQNLKSLEKILSFFSIYDFGVKEAKEYAKLRANLE